MENVLDNKKAKEKSYDQIERSVLDTIQRLDQKHPIERKIKFFLDIRGYLKLNAVKGNYIEFGSYQSWTQFAAYKILDATNMINRYYGCDIFSGEPEPNADEASHMPGLTEGDFSVDFDGVNQFVAEMLRGKGELIRGDFRSDEVKNKVEELDLFNLVVVDCNWISSMEAALNMAFSNITPGAVLFVDDYFTNFGQGKAVIMDLVYSLSSKNNLRLIEHGFYPPFAKSFIIEK